MEAGNLHFLMDETDAPYNENEIQYGREDDLQLVKFAKENGLVFEPETPLGQLFKKIYETV